MVRGDGDPARRGRFAILTPYYPVYQRRSIFTIE